MVNSNRDGAVGKALWYLLGVVIAIGLFFAFGYYADREMYRGWGRFFEQGLQCEKDGRYDEAIRFYAEVDTTPDEISIWAWDFRARCFFLLGDIDNAVRCYDELYEGLPVDIKRDLRSQSDWAFTCARMQKEGKHEEAIELANTMIAKVTSLYHTYYPNALSYRSHYYEGASEGYVRKCYSLMRLSRDDEARALLEDYARRHRADVVNGASRAGFACGSVRRTIGRPGWATTRNSG